jgi:beta-lactamase class A
LRKLEYNTEIRTIGLKKNLAVAVFVSDSPADLVTRERVIAQVAKTMWDKWSSKP